jgi:formyltetrahydrofolate deformylase
VETDFEVRPAGSRTWDAGRRAGDRYAETGRLLITCPDRPGIIAAVSRFLFSSGVNITESQQYSADPFGGPFSLRIEFHRAVLAERFGDLAGSFGELAGRFSMRWQMTGASELKRVAIIVSKAGHVRQEILRQEILWWARWGEMRAGITMVSWHLADRLIVHQNKTIVFT